MEAKPAGLNLCLTTYQINPDNNIIINDSTEISPNSCVSFTLDNCRRCLSKRMNNTCWGVFILILLLNAVKCGTRSVRSVTFFDHF